MFGIFYNTDCAADAPPPTRLARNEKGRPEGAASCFTDVATVTYLACSICGTKVEICGIAMIRSRMTSIGT